MVFHTADEDYCYFLNLLKLITDTQNQETFYENGL
jgi:hypothetical protein